MRFLKRLISRIGYPRSAEMIVMSVLTLLVLIVLVPGLLARREQVRKQQVADRIRQMGLGLNNYHDTFESFPASPAARDSQTGNSSPAARKNSRQSPRSNTDHSTELISPL